MTEGGQDWDGDGLTDEVSEMNPSGSIPPGQLSTALQKPVVQGNVRICNS